MDREKLRERLLGIFVSELEVHVGVLRDGLTAMQTASATNDGQRLELLCRAAHTLKGAARSAAVPLLQSAGYAMERIFKAAEERRCVLDADLIRFLLRVTEAVDEARRRLGNGHDLGSAPLAALLEPLEDAAVRCSGGC